YGHSRSGTAGNPITVKAETPRVIDARALTKNTDALAVILKPGSGLQHTGAQGSNSIIGFHGQSFWTFDGLLTDGTNMTAVVHFISYKNGTTLNNDILIQNCEMREGIGNYSGSNTQGVGTENGDSRWIVRNNIIHDMGMNETTYSGLLSYGIYAGKGDDGI